jgi:hypothetical protein
MMKNRIAASFLCVAFFSIHAWAHHAFSSEFDIRRPIHLSGEVTEAEFVNPHAWLHVSVKGEDGATKEWIIEAGSPNGLLRRGITKLSIPVGTDVVIDGYAAKDGSLRGSGQDLTLPDGRKLHISGTRVPGQ